MKNASDTKKRIALKAVNDYIYYLTDKRRVIVTNLIAGIMRGLGSAVGFWVISAVIIWVISIIAGKLPFIQRLVDLFDQAMQKYSAVK